MGEVDGGGQTRNTRKVRERPRKGEVGLACLAAFRVTSACFASKIRCWLGGAGESLSRPWCAGALLLLLALTLFSKAGETANENGWRVWLEPKSTHAPVTLPIAGAERTELCAGFMEEEGPRAMTREELAGMGIEMARFAARARANAGTDLAGLKPRYVRNGKRVIEYAELHSERPVVADAVLAPKFLALFKDTLGEKVLVVVPNRFTAYVFPALSGNHPDYAPLVLEALRATAWPVSAELLEISADGVRCVGRFAEP